MLCNDGMEKFDTKYKTIDKVGNQKNPFRVTTTCNNRRKKRTPTPV